MSRLTGMWMGNVVVHGHIKTAVEAAHILPLASGQATLFPPSQSECFRPDYARCRRDLARRRLECPANHGDEHSASARQRVGLAVLDAKSGRRQHQAALALSRCCAGCGVPCRRKSDAWRVWRRLLLKQFGARRHGGQLKQARHGRRQKARRAQRC